MSASGVEVTIQLELNIPEVRCCFCDHRIPCSPDVHERMEQHYSDEHARYIRTVTR